MIEKHEIEAIMLGIVLKGEDLLKVKIYKDGSLYRKGCLGRPTLDVVAKINKGPTDIWKEIQPDLVTELLKTRSGDGYEEKNRNNTLELYISYSGKSRGEATGEKAKWEKESGYKFVLDQDSSFRSTLLSEMYRFIATAADLTNKWYFDAVIGAVYDLKPKERSRTVILGPKATALKEKTLKNYLKQMEYNQRDPFIWNLVGIGNNRIFSNKKGRPVATRVQYINGQYEIKLIDFFGPPSREDQRARKKK